MNPEFPSFERLFRIVRRVPRTHVPPLDQGLYTEVASALRKPSLSDAVDFYERTYAHDDRNGTEVIFTSNRDDFYVLRIDRPEPKVTLVPVRVA